MSSSKLIYAVALYYNDTAYSNIQLYEHRANAAKRIKHGLDYFNCSQQLRTDAPRLFRATAPYLLRTDLLIGGQLVLTLYPKYRDISVQLLRQRTKHMSWGAIACQSLARIMQGHHKSSSQQYPY